MAEETLDMGLGGAVTTLFTKFPEGSGFVGASEVFHCPSTRNLYSAVVPHGILTVAVKPVSSLARRTEFDHYKFQVEVRTYEYDK